MTGESIKTKLLATTLLVGLSGGIWAGAAVAQDADDPIVVEQADDDDAAVQERVVVTGSRIKRDSFTSTSPLQVLTSEVASDSGLFDTASLITSQPVFQGVQVGSDISAGGFATNNGPGTSTVSLRGLGADRTLILINGRRLAPAGVGGAPSNPNINFIPSSLIQSVETVTDGASAVYGSDAIAGAVNVILRDEFDGLSINATFDKPQADGGTQQRYGVTWGTVGERGKFLVAAEYFRSGRIQADSRDFTRSDEGFSCDLDIEVDPTTGDEFRTCGGAITNIIVNPFTGFAATANPNLGSLGTPLIAPDGTVVPGVFNTGDLDDLDFRSIPFEGGDQISPETQRFSIYSTGDTDINILGHETNAFVEVGYSNVQTDTTQAFGGQIFPTVGADNPFNPFGDSVFGAGNGNAVTLVFNDPIIRGNVSSEIQQTRFFGGFRGDVDFFAGQTDFFNDWSYEISGGYTRSLSSFNQPAILEENIALSISTTVDNGDGTFSCGLDAPTQAFGFLSLQGCVPLNLFQPGLFSSDPNNPPTLSDEELDFITGVRSAATVVDQTIFGGFVGGPVFENPFFGGEIQALVGFEWREDSFFSGTDTVNQDGLAAGFAADPVSDGAVDLLEFYGEVVVPLVRDVPFVKELNFEGSVRYLDPEFTRSDVVYSLKGNYRPFDWLNIRGTYGTSYRAPNARETFLSGQTSFANPRGVDPCLFPILAAGEQDQRPQQILDNCTASGVDPLTLGTGGTPSFTLQTSGNQNLLPEQSTAWTAGFVVDQPFTDFFNASLSVSYFDIEIEDVPDIIAPAEIVNNCLTSASFPNEAACDLFTRDPNTGFLDLVQQSPLNIALEGVEGVDINVNVSKTDIQALGRQWRLSTDIVSTYSISREEIEAIGSPAQEFIGDISNPAWRANFQARLATGPWSLFYRFDFIGATTDRNTNLDISRDTGVDGDFSFGGAATPAAINGGLGDAVDSVDEYFNHTLSARYAGDGWILRAGINNLTNVQPPQIDQNVPAGTIFNVPFGSGFDTRGRTFFMNVVKEF